MLLETKPAVTKDLIHHANQCDFQAGHGLLYTWQSETSGKAGGLAFGHFSQERRCLDPDRSSFLGNQQGKQAFRVL